MKFKNIPCKYIRMTQNQNPNILRPENEKGSHIIIITRTPVTRKHAGKDPTPAFNI